MAQRIHMVGVHGLLGGPQASGYSLGIDAMFRKAARLSPSITYALFEQYEDARTYADMVKAHKSGALVVGSGHSLGAPDIVHAAHRLVAEHRAIVPLLFLFDGTWNAPSPPIQNGIRRVINFYGSGFSLLGHDRIEPAPGYRGSISNHAVFASHISVDDDLNAHAMFLREIAWLLDPAASSVTLPKPVTAEVTVHEDEEPGVRRLGLPDLSQEFRAPMV